MRFKRYARRIDIALEQFDMATIFQEDQYSKKVNLSQGSYLYGMGIPWVMPVVKDVKRRLAKNEVVDNFELPLFGLSSLRNAAMTLALGKDCKRIAAREVLSVQTLSGSGALKLISDVAVRSLKCKEVFLSSHVAEDVEIILIGAGLSEGRRYRYYDINEHKLDITGMLADLSDIPVESLVYLQGCCHDPTGCDPSRQEWMQIARVVWARRLFPIIDLSHQGIATGDVDEDAYSVRLFAKLGIEMAIVVSFSKNFLIYNEKVGAAIFVLRGEEGIAPLKSHVGTLILGQYGSPPFYGAKIVATILNDPLLYNNWTMCLKQMVEHLTEARYLLVNALKRYNASGNWDYIQEGVGKFTHTGLSERQIQHLILYHHIYVDLNGRMNLSGLNEDNIDYVAEAIANSIEEYPKQEESD